MTLLSVNPHSLLLRLKVNDATGFSLSHACAQMADSDTLARLKGPSPAMICARYDHVTCDIIDLFLDLKENFPHSKFQTDEHND